MGTLDKITQMKNQGFSEGDIINNLKEQGVSPKAINEAMDQSKIKQAISDSGQEATSGNTIPAGRSARAQEQGQNVPNDEFYIPQGRAPLPKGPPTQEYSKNQDQIYSQNYNADTFSQTYDAEYNQNYNQNYGSQPYGAYEQPENYGSDYGSYEEPYGGYAPQNYNEEYYPQEGYESGSNYGGYDEGTDIMIEIAEQVFAEKMKKIEKQIEELNEFKTLAETKLNNATDRLKRIEETIDKLQSAILEKVGFYGRGVENLKKEMEMMQESFSKTLPNLVSKSSASHLHKKPTRTNSKKNN